MKCPFNGYMLEAFRNVIMAEGQTPYLMINVTENHTQPKEFMVNDTQAVFSVDEVALKAGTFEVHNLETLTFTTRVAGRSVNIFIPLVDCVVLYAKEDPRMNMSCIAVPSLLDVIQGVEPANKDVMPIQDYPPKRSKPTLTVIQGGKTA